MPNVNLSPYDARTAALQRRRQLAQALQQQSMAPLDLPEVAGAKVSPWQGVNKLVQALFSGMDNRKLDKEETALAGEMQADRQSQAKALVDALIQQPQGLQIGMAPTQQAALPSMGGGYEAQPESQAPEGSRTLPVMPGQVDSRNAQVQAIAQAMSGQNPQYGELALQNVLQGQRDQQGQQFDIKKLMMQQKAQADQLAAQQRFTAGQNTLDRGLTASEGQANRQNRTEIETMGNLATSAENDKRLRAQSEEAALERASREKIAREQIAGAAARAQQDGKSSRATTLASQWSNQFNNNDIVKNYAVIQDGLNFAKGTGSTSADDIGLLYAFAKAMDPNSVVREGEYATVQKYAQSWAQAYGFKLERMVANTRFLSDEARKNLVGTIEAKAKAAKTSYDNFREETNKKFKNIGEDPEEWIANYDLKPKTSGPKVGTIENGYKFLGGNPADPKSWSKQ